MTKVFVSTILVLVLMALLETEAGWMCTDKSKVILDSYLCDADDFPNADPDCDDGSDESEENCFFCDEYSTPKTTTPRFTMCDGAANCDDGSDEDDTHCFQCTDGSQKIPRSNMCDKTAHCGDESDELSSTCPNQVKCFINPAIGYVYRNGKKCNGVKDCPTYGEDENNCESDENSNNVNGNNDDYDSDDDNSDNVNGNNDDHGSGVQEDKKMKPYIQGSRIPGGKWQCPDNNEEIDNKQLCDGKPDCNDNSDEDDILCANKWKCNEEDKEILNSFVCDDIPDCQNGADEDTDLCEETWNEKIRIKSAEASSKKSMIEQSHYGTHLSQKYYSCWHSSTKEGEWANYTLKYKANVRSVEILFLGSQIKREDAEKYIISVCDDVNGAESCLPCGPVGTIPEPEKEKLKSVKCWGHFGRNVKIEAAKLTDKMSICHIQIKGTNDYDKRV